MIENGLFILSGLETQLHDILCAVHDGKNHGRSEGKENIGEFPVKVGGRGLSDARFSRTIRAWVRGTPLLSLSNCTAGYMLLNPSDQSLAVN